MNIFDELGSQIPIAVNRQTGPQQSLNGVIAPAPIEQLIVTACVQPLGGSQLLMFPEGDRIRKSIRIYSEQKFNIIDEVHKIQADRITYEDELFEVVTSEKWETEHFRYFKSVARRVDR